MNDPSALTVETPADFGADAAAVAARWISELDIADKAFADWRKRCRKIIKRYREERPSTTTARRYAILWANVQTLGPAIYARTPTAVVSRRYKDADPVGRLASEVLERAINFAVDAYDFEGLMQGVRDEYLLLARGQAWVRYIPTLAPSLIAPPADPKAVTGEADNADPGEVTDDADMGEVVKWEEARADYVPWEDFLHNPARHWGEVRWVARRVCMDRDELRARFKAPAQPDNPLDARVMGDLPPLDWDTTGGKSDDDQFKKAQIFEIWDISSRRVFWISKGLSTTALDIRDDPLGLRDFFPCPKPLFGTLGPDSLVPTPDYVYYQDQAEELDELTARVDKLTDSLKVRGFYAGQVKDDLDNLMRSEDSTLIPVATWAMITDAGGIKGLVDWFPVDQVANVLKQCIDLRKELIADIYQITGVADVMRGASEPEETATAQGIKAHWGSIRVRDRQREVARFARDTVRLMGEVIASRFGAETLAAMTNVQLQTGAEKAQALQTYQQQVAMTQMQAQQPGVGTPGALGGPQPGGAPPAVATPPPPPPPPELSQPSWDDVTALLSDNATRAFRIDIETDSTIEPNEMEDKARRVEFVTAIGKLMGESLPMLQAAPQTAPIVSEAIKFLVRGFRAGREMEDVIDRVADQLAQSPAQPQGAQQPQPPDPADQAKAQAAQTNAQANVIKAQTGQQQVQVDAAKLQSEHAIGMAQIQAENNRTATQAHVDHTDIAQQALAKAAERADQRAFTAGPLVPPTRQ